MSALARQESINWSNRMDHSTTSQMTYIANAVTAVGSGGFPEMLGNLCLSVFNFDSIFISVFSQDLPPRQLYSNLDAEATRRTVGPYLSHAYLLDPFYGLFKSDIGNRVVSLEECAPDDFKTTEYYKIFYSEIGLRDEVTIFVGAGNGTSIALSLGQRYSDVHCPPEATAQLDALLPVIAALCHKHWPNLDVPGNQASPDMGLVFDRFGTTRLSTREAEIVRLMLKGHSTKSIARLLGNSPETIKVHRKRIYAKLKISSQGELFCKFIGAQAAAPTEAEAATMMLS
ncbi:helix-turn-helix transcriptional regulator [Phyllobacterium sp. OV277]|uniref:helix-turn-helix transcriptional regulator n=1 Tax=Phyllobacterium sp. OV277 TaxID=1882772 RepID=UPI000B837EA3|nr:helix-turn-helix transcriptional regulator [Phyllobacterium sp. OV277]